METKTKNTFRSKQTRLTDTKFSQLETKKSLTVGTLCDVEITALGPNGVGLASLNRNITVFVPNTQVGEQVKIEITKIQSLTNKSKYAIGRKVKTIKQEAISLPNIVGTVLQLKITKPGPLGSGQAEYNLGNGIYPVIIPNAKVGNEYSILITRLKKQYGFGKIVSKNSSATTNIGKLTNSTLKVGSSLTLTVPQNTPRYGKFVALKVQTNNESTVVLVRLNLGAKAGQRVRVQITKILNIKIQDSPVLLAKVIKLAPLSASTLKLRTRQMVHQMVKHGLHFGDKTVKCQANMKKYLWAPAGKSTTRPMVKNGRYFVNLLKTRQCLKQALKAVSKYAAKGRTFLFVGTSKISSSLIARAALFSKNFFVNTRWLGGMLTNWKTIVKSISKIRPILQQKQEIMTKILQKRQRIKQYFLSKLDKLNTKTKLLVQIGRTVLQRLQTTSNTGGNNWITFSLLTRSNLLMQKRQQLIEKAQILFTKRQQLLAKSELLEKTNQQLVTNVSQLQTKYTQLITQYNLKRTKLRELKALLLVSIQLTKLAEQQGEQTFVGPYAQLTKYATTNQASTTLAIVPNPSKDLFNKMIIAMRSQNDGNQSFVNAKTENSNLVVFSKLLLKFSQSSGYLQTQIKTIYGELQQLAADIRSTNSLLVQQKELFAKRLQVKHLISKELTNVRAQLAMDQKIVAIVKTKLMRLDAQRRLLSFIPRVKTLAVRYKAVGSMNPAEATAAKQNIQQTVQLVMRRLVDPKMKYSIDKIYDAKLRSKSKKTAAARKKKWQSLLKYFGGIANMTKLTRKQISNNIAIIVGQQENMNAVRECKKMGIKMLNIVDTNCNPALADHIIPANDDSRNSIKYVLTHLLTYIRLAQKLRTRIQEVQANTKRIQKVFKGTVGVRTKKTRRIS